MHQYEKNKEATFAIDFMQSRVRHPIVFRILYKIRYKMILHAIPFKNTSKILKVRKSNSIVYSEL